MSASGTSSSMNNGPPAPSICRFVSPSLSASLSSLNKSSEPYFEDRMDMELRLAPPLVPSLPSLSQDE